jgi:hypothetical protein
MRNHASMGRQLEWWFRGGAALAGTHHSPRPILGINLIANPPLRFADDEKAVALALQGIDAGHYDTLKNPWEKTFFFLPIRRVHVA